MNIALFELKKSHFQIANVCLLLSLSYLLADVTTFYLEIVLTPSVMTPIRDVDANSERKDVIRPFSDYTNISASLLFSNTAPIGNTDYNEQSLNVTAATDLKIVLKGTVTGSPSFVKALIQKTGAAKAEFFKLGDDVYGVRLANIFRDKVILDNNGQMEELLLYKEYQMPQRGMNSEVKVLSRTELNQQIFNNIDNVSKNVAVAPYFVDGKMSGVRITRLEKNHIVTEVGLQKSDIIKRINGHTIDSMEKALHLWENMKNESLFIIDVERNSQILNLTLKIKE